jgi:signal transduction histidine kinase
VQGKLEINRAQVDLEAVVRGAVETAAERARARGVTFEVTTEPAPVSGDAARLEQVVGNLLSNAIQFSPEGGEVDVEVARAGHDAVIRVRDYGAGIDPEFLPHVFEQFRQADGGLSRQHGGLGLGLTIVRQLVELHGGRVEAESSGPGRGATFTVRLPIQVDSRESMVQSR